MTTIITKNGSGAPTAGQLSEGELAVDLTNKELYTKSGSTVIKIGSQGGSSGTFTDLTATSSFTSPGIDDNANATAITIDASENVGIGNSTPSYQLTVGNGTDTLETINIVSTDASQSRIFFSDASNTGQGRLTYDHSDDSLHMFTNDTEAMRISSSGNVGIGTNNPTSKMVVEVGNNEPASSGNMDTGMVVQSGNGSRAINMGGSNTGGYNWINSAYANNSSVAANLVLMTGTQERMRIDTSGNVGIGTTSPSAIISSSKIAQVASTGNTTLSVASTDSVNDRSAIVELLSSGNGNSKSIILYGDTDTSPSTPSPLVFQGYHSGARTERMRLDASGNLNIGDTTWYAAAANRRHLHLKGGANGSFLALSTSGSGDAYLDCDNGGSFSVWNRASGDMKFGANNVERMRLEASGSLLVGTTSADVITNKATGVRLEGGYGNVNLYSGTRTCVNLGRANNGVMLQFWINGANTSGGISTTQGGTPTFFASSDKRLKENIVDHESELANVMSLRPARWDWKKDEQGSGEGFIAQELEQTAWSDLVAEGEDGFKTVAGLGTVETRIIKAMQEQQAMIETLQAEVAALKGA